MSPTQTDIVADTKHRDAEILRLWGAGWSSKKIAEDLDIKASTVVNVVHRNKAARNPRGPRVAVTAGLDDAPIEAWQQAMLPHLQQVAEANGFDGIGECAFVFLCLLRLKPFEKIDEFKDWAHRVTRYPRYEINRFVERAIEGFLIVDGRSNADAFEALETDDGTGDVEVMLMAMVLEGKFCRNAAGEYSLSEETA